MKPKTKRWLAKEWLILICSWLVGSCYSFVDQYQRYKSNYWNDDNPSDTVWIEDIKQSELPDFLTASYGGKSKDALRNILKKIHDSEELEIQNLAEISVAEINLTNPPPKRAANIMPNPRFEALSQDFRSWKILYSNSQKGAWRCFIYILKNEFFVCLGLGIFEGVMIYLLLWAPRLTFRAIQTLRRVPDGD